MSTILHLSLREYDRMIERGAFEGIHKRIELIHGELREMNPAGPVHDDLIEYLSSWSNAVTSRNTVRVRVQSGFDLPELESRPVPDILWVQPKRYMKSHPKAADALLAIEVANSSLESDLNEMAVLYSAARINEYWIVDIQARCIHIFREPSDMGYQSKSKVGIDGTIAPLVEPTVVLDIADLFGV